MSLDNFMRVGVWASGAVVWGGLLAPSAYRNQIEATGLSCCFIALATIGVGVARLARQSRKGRR